MQPASCMSLGYQMTFANTRHRMYMCCRCVRGLCGVFDRARSFSTNSWLVDRVYIELVVTEAAGSDEPRL